MLLLVVVLATDVADAARHEIVERQRLTAEAADSRPWRCDGALGHAGRANNVLYIYAMHGESVTSAAAS